jgi:hypothetical protein
MRQTFKEKLPPGNNQRSTLRVCMCCSVMLSIVDNDDRLQEHFRGKQHLAMVRRSATLTLYLQPLSFAVPVFSCFAVVTSLYVTGCYGCCGV